MCRAKKDYFFLILASFLWFFALAVTIWDFITLQRMIFRLDFFKLIGFLGAFLGVILRIQARRTLKQFFSPTLKVSEDHQLIIEGIYNYLRHPAYLGSLFLSFGIPLIFSSLYGFICMLLFIPCILYRIHIEEQMFIEKFGKDYLNYRKRVKRLIPYIY
ncbi:MAG: methyltransferase family protein [Promethearchaeota archaeon]